MRDESALLRRLLDDLREELEAAPLTHAAMRGFLDALREELDAEPLTLGRVVAWAAARNVALAHAPPEFGLCACMGKREGEPVCRCAMRDVIKAQGRYLMVRDLGPA